LNLQVQEVSDAAGLGMTEKYAIKNHPNIVSSWYRI